MWRPKRIWDTWNGIRKSRKKRLLKYRGKKKGAHRNGRFSWLKSWQEGALQWWLSPCQVDTVEKENLQDKQQRNRKFLGRWRRRGNECNLDRLRRKRTVMAFSLIRSVRERWRGVHRNSRFPTKRFRVKRDKKNNRKMRTHAMAAFSNSIAKKLKCEKKVRN